MTREEARTLFQYAHLPMNLQRVSKPFYDMAVGMFGIIPDEKGAMRTKALNDLWQAKNWAVAAVAQE